MGGGLASVYGQDYSIECKNARTKRPISNVLIQDAESKLGFTNDDGVLSFSSNTGVIICTHLSYIDTVVYLNTNKTQIFLNESNYNLTEANIKARYYPHKHLNRLINNNRKCTFNRDTAIYYYFEELMSLPELNVGSEIKGAFIYYFQGYDDYKEGQDSAIILNIYSFTSDIPDSVDNTFKDYDLIFVPSSNVLSWDKEFRKRDKLALFRKHDSLVFTIEKPKTQQIYDLHFTNGKLEKMDHGQHFYANNLIVDYTIYMDTVLMIADSVYFNKTNTIEADDGYRTEMKTTRIMYRIDKIEEDSDHIRFDNNEITPENYSR